MVTDSAEQAKTPATGPAAGVAGVDVATPAHSAERKERAA